LHSRLEQNKNNGGNPATGAQGFLEKVCVESGDGDGRALVRRDDPALGSNQSIEAGAGERGA
jgi:hypothetical protein